MPAHEAGYCVSCTFEKQPIVNYNRCPVFQSTYRAFPVAAIDKESLEYGDKVVLPASALDQLLKAQIDYPMLFRVLNPRTHTHLHCGVMEFVAEEGMAYLPYWLMQSLTLREGDLVNFTNVTLPKGNYVKLRPQTKDFLDVSNPKAVLEKNLRLFTCLTKGGTVPINYNGKRFLIDIVELKPADAVSIVETDCDTDFEKPLDYVEPEEAQQEVGDLANRENQVDTALQRPADGSAPHQDEHEQNTHPEPTFVAFQGAPKRLDGRPAAASASSPGDSSQATTSSQQQQKRASPIAKTNKKTMEEQQKEHEQRREEAKKEQEQRRSQGKLVFGASRPVQGSNQNNNQNANQKDQCFEQKDTGFEAFKGKARTLKD